jgi:hypothetical protein
LADDLTIVVLSNLIDSHPDRFVDGIASILDPRLPKIRSVSPVVGADAAETQRVTQWLVGLAQGEVPSRETLGSRRMLREQLVDYGKQLRSLGSIQRVELISNLPVGDERAYIYRANYQAGVVRVEFVRAADGRIMDFSVEPE